MKVLVIVDMQNDFITGTLANKEAEKIVAPICEYIKEFDGDIFLTLDTHTGNYLNTNEGKSLPITHCIKGTEGWLINSDIFKTILEKQTPYYEIEKPTFGFKDWESFLNNNHVDEIIMVGTCTDICVISNALILKAVCPESKIVVLKDLCAGLTPEKHEAALEVMRSCQIEVI